MARLPVRFPLGCFALFTCSAALGHLGCSGGDSGSTGQGEAQSSAAGSGGSGSGSTTSSSGGTQGCGTDVASPDMVLPDAVDPTGGKFTLDQALAGLPNGPDPLRAIIDTDLGTLTSELRPTRPPTA